MSKLQEYTSDFGVTLKYEKPPKEKEDDFDAALGLSEKESDRLIDVATQIYHSAGNLPEAMMSALINAETTHEFVYLVTWIADMIGAQSWESRLFQLLSEVEEGQSDSEIPKGPVSLMLKYALTGARADSQLPEFRNWISKEKRKGAKQSLPLLKKLIEQYNAVSGLAGEAETFEDVLAKARAIVS